MAASAFFNRVQFNATSSGLVDFVVASGQTGFRTPAGASIPNGTVVSYTAVNPNSANPSEWETGQGAYNSGTVTVPRTTIRESSNSNAKVNFSSAPVVFLDVQ